ncbi:MAG: hypothetical protein ACLT98_06825 [Eggerthellaceae bacterium]
MPAHRRARERIAAGLNAERKLTMSATEPRTASTSTDMLCRDGRRTHVLYTEDAVYRTPLRLYELETSWPAPNSYAHPSSCWRTRPRGCHPPAINARRSCCWTTENR